MNDTFCKVKYITSGYMTLLIKKDLYNSRFQIDEM